MSNHKNHLITLSIEALSNLRDLLFQAYSKNNKYPNLPTKSKNSPFYNDLRDELLKETKTVISEGTLVKFYYNDTNRKYKNANIRAIEEYIKKMLPTEEVGKDFVKPEKSLLNGSNLMQDERTLQELKVFATKVYIELTTRKAAIPIDEDHDVIEEIYNSWYKLFCVIRDEMKTLPIHCFKDSANPDSVIGLSNKILNEILRPHLTEYQAKYRKWLENEKKDAKNKHLTPQELQKIYPDYDNLIKSLKETNQMFSEVAKLFFN